jgi:hypothetical protein
VAEKTKPLLSYHDVLNALLQIVLGNTKSARAVAYRARLVNVGGTAVRKAGRGWWVSSASPHLHSCISAILRARLAWEVYCTSCTPLLLASRSIFLKSLDYSRLLCYRPFTARPHRHISHLWWSAFNLWYTEGIETCMGLFQHPPNRPPHTQPKQKKPPLLLPKHAVGQRCLQ